MATYRLMDGQSGRPGVGSSGTQPPTSPTSYNGNYTTGIVFEVTQGGKYFEGYWWWVPTGGDTNANVGLALMQITGSSTTAVVPASEVLWAGTFTTNAWNFIPCTPIPLTPNIPYLAAIGYNTIIGFPKTGNQFGSGQPYVNGITNGPLFAYPSGSANAASWPQQPYTIAGADPSVTPPVQNDQNDLLWIDVQISDQVPVNTPVRAWPNMLSPWPAMTSTTDQTGYTLGMEFSVTQTSSLAKIWHYSPSTASVLPSRCALWDVSLTSTVSGTDNQSPTWLLPNGAAAAAGGGWVYCDYSASNISLVGNKNYKVSTFHGSGANWFGKTTNVFSSGDVQANGFTNGVLTIPNNSGATPGQQSWNAGAWGYPATSSSPDANWIDVEVIPLAASTLFGLPASPASVQSDGTSYTLGTQFSLPKSAPLTGIWFYSGAGAGVLPGACAIYAVSGQSIVSGTQNNAPTWSGAAGSGWVKCTYDGSVTLAANTQYKVCVAGGGVAQNWYTATNHYWDTGAGQYGVSTGALTAPNAASASGSNQCTFVVGGGSNLAYPTSMFEAGNYWIDVEVMSPRYRIMDGQNGRPSTGPGTAVSYSGNFIAGTSFSVRHSNSWFEGYWWWVCPTGGLTAVQKCALWVYDSFSPGSSTVVPGSVVTSSTLSVGWNYIPLTTPVPLSVSTIYIAATGVNGNFPDSDTAGQGTGAVDSFGTGGHVNGISSGPIFAYSDNGNGGLVSAINDGGGALGQGLFSTGGTDPSVVLPNQVSNSANFWVDAQVSVGTPASYAGSFRAWPNPAKNANEFTSADGSINYIVGTEMHLSKTATLNKIWYYSPSGTAQLATECAIWNIATQTKVAESASPTWSAAAGTGWLSCNFSGVVLPAGRYKVAVYNGAASPDGWSAKQPYYFNVGNGTIFPQTGMHNAGPSFDGITNDLLYVPSLSNASSANYYTGAGSNSNFDTGGPAPGQATFAVGPPNAYPNLYVKGLGQTYWVDMEITPGGILSSSGSGVLLALFP